jgi:hypothetical protein
MLSSVGCLTLLNISTLYHKRHDLKKKKKNTEQKICVLCLSLQFLSEEFLILRRNQQDTINVHRFSCKVPINTCQLLIKLEFSAQILEKYTNKKISRKSVHWELSCTMPTDGRMDVRDEAISRFTQFCETA